MIRRLVGNAEAEITVIAQLNQLIAGVIGGGGGFEPTPLFRAIVQCVKSHPPTHPLPSSLSPSPHSLRLAFLSIRPPSSPYLSFLSFSLFSSVSLFLVFISGGFFHFLGNKSESARPITARHRPLICLFRGNFNSDFLLGTFSTNPFKKKNPTKTNENNTAPFR